MDYCFGVFSTKLHVNILQTMRSVALNVLNKWSNLFQAPRTPRTIFKFFVKILLFTFPTGCKTAVKENDIF